MFGAGIERTKGRDVLEPVGVRLKKSRATDHGNSI